MRDLNCFSDALSSRENVSLNKQKVSLLPARRDANQQDQFDRYRKYGNYAI
jgi:hypothetical protein